MSVRQIAGILLGGGVLVGAVGCAEQHPAWIAEVPQSRSELCAVGISGPTYYAEDARVNSKAAAMTELARAVAVTVTSHLTMQTTGNATSSDTAIRERAGFKSDVVLQHAQVREQWVQTGDGGTYGAKGTIFTLACTPIP